MGYHKIVFEDESLEVVNQEFQDWWSTHQTVTIVSDTTTTNAVYTRTVVYQNGV